MVNWVIFKQTNSTCVVVLTEQGNRMDEWSSRWGVTILYYIVLLLLLTFPLLSHICLSTIIMHKWINGSVYHLTRLFIVGNIIKFTSNSTNASMISIHSTFSCWFHVNSFSFVSFSTFQLGQLINYFVLWLTHCLKTFTFETFTFKTSFINKANNKVIPLICKQQIVYYF